MAGMYEFRNGRYEVEVLLGRIWVHLHRSPPEYETAKELLAQFADSKSCGDREPVDDIELLELPLKLCSLLRAYQITTVADLKSSSREKLLNIPGLSVGYLAKIESSLFSLITKNSD